MVTDRQVARWRLRNQHLLEPHADSATDVVGRLLAVQAENPAQAAWAVACRTVRADPADLDGLLAGGAVVRTHVLRPTWHFVGADDAGWLLELTAPRIRPPVLRQLTVDCGVDPVTLDRSTSVLLEALVQQPDRTRAHLGAQLRAHGIEPTGQVLMLLLALLELDGLVCSGRPDEGTHTYALFSDRVPAGRQLDREEALAELALRYLTGHGPATDRDLAYWATLTLQDARHGIDAIRDRLASFDHDGRTFWHLAEQSPPVAAGVPAGHLLQILDEMYRGYQESRMVLDCAGVVPLGRETAIGMALVDARMVARMKRSVGRRAAFDLWPYDDGLDRVELAALEEAAARYAGFLGLEHELRVH